MGVLVQALHLCAPQTSEGRSLTPDEAVQAVNGGDDSVTAVGLARRDEWGEVGSFTRKPMRYWRQTFAGYIVTNTLYNDRICLCNECKNMQTELRTTEPST
jgi:hypothetical protein